MNPAHGSRSGGEDGPNVWWIRLVTRAQHWGRVAVDPERGIRVLVEEGQSADIALTRIALSRYITEWTTGKDAAGMAAGLPNPLLDSLAESLGVDWRGHRVYALDGWELVEVSEEPEAKPPVW